MLALGLIALGGRCMLPTMVSCSATTLFGGPALDVPYKTTRRDVVALMLEMGEVKAGDTVIDLGTGDGRILIAAAKERGAKGLGVDLDHVLIAKARDAAADAGVADRVRFEAADLFKTDLSSADVVTMYLLPEVNLRLRPQLFAQLKPGTRVVSHAFDMGDWKPEAKRRAGDRRSICGGYRKPLPRPPKHPVDRRGVRVYRPRARRDSVPRALLS
ncbi:cyclopropane-fatty-acyl-phospholipid synthase family protein [Sphingomonas sp. J315]|uniref:SAM-dependent methyltransferase n=1 Tax=Sphingomonas sp. J315 TaxID=2898433 RepID=UPI0021AD5167|nr:methyltransferase domain-containing protein [Sphingomonas sp. J315]UUX99922.1 50S ribosomal protein L11 methyltransferase [Sphingomonas sp. J315]